MSLPRPRAWPIWLAAAVPLPGAAQAAGEVGLPLGSVPRAVVIEDLEGNDVDLDGYIGHGPVLIEFWATWCKLCEALAPEMASAVARYGDRVVFLGVAVSVNQSKGSVRRRLRDHPVGHAMLWDTRGRAASAFKAPSTSYVVILDARGRVVYTGVGGDQRIVAALDDLLAP